MVWRIICTLHCIHCTYIDKALHNWTYSIYESIICWIFWCLQSKLYLYLRTLWNQSAPEKQLPGGKGQRSKFACSFWKLQHNGITNQQSYCTICTESQSHCSFICLVSHCCWSRCVVRLGLASSGSTVWNLYDLAGRFVWVLAVTISHPDYNRAQNRSRVVQGGQSEAALSRSFAIKLRRVILADSMLRRVLDLTYFNRILVYT